MRHLGLQPTNRTNREGLPSFTAPGDGIPPCSEEAERCVLGAILIDAERVMDVCAEKGLRTESFYGGENRFMFEAAMSLWRDGRPIDALTVSEKLRTMGELDRLGGTTFVDGFIDATPTAAHAEYYADLVVSKDLLRRTIHCATVWGRTKARTT